MEQQLSLEAPISPRARLSSIDWSFLHRPKPNPIESIHPYPAKFIGEIPRSFIENLTVPERSAVFDPFCGSGTTLVEAQRAGLPAIGVDVNPIACLISRIKTTHIPRNFADAVVEVVTHAKTVRAKAPTHIPNVDHWFKPDVQVAIGGLVQAISESKFSDCIDHLRLTLSSILVRVSNQDSDTRYAAVAKSVGKDEVFEAYMSAAQKLQSALLARDWSLTPVDVIEADTLELDSRAVASNVGLVITSPPYPNAYEYWLYHKYRMWWLGFDPLIVKEREIGARAHFFKKNHHRADLFVDQMRRTFGLIDSVLVSGGYVCFVVGRSKIHGEIIDNGSILELVGEEAGLRRVARLDRAMDSNRKSFNLSHAKIKSEALVVFQKP